MNRIRVILYRTGMDGEEIVFVNDANTLAAAEQMENELRESRYNDGKEIFKGLKTDEEIREWALGIVPKASSKDRYDNFIHTKIREMLSCEYTSSNLLLKYYDENDDYFIVKRLFNENSVGTRNRGVGGDFVVVKYNEAGYAVDLDNDDIKKCRGEFDNYKF